MARKPLDTWERLDSLTPADPGITIAEYASRYRVTHASAEGKLKRLAAIGTLVKGKRISGGRLVNVFRFPD